MTEGLRILFATAIRYLPHGVGGMQYSVHHLSQALHARGAETAVLCAGAAEQNPQEVVRDTYGGYPVFRAAKPAEALPAVLAAFRPHAVVIQSGELVPIVRASLIAGTATIVYFRDVIFGEDLFAPNKDILFLASSSFTAGRAKAMFNLDCHVVPAFIRLDDYVTESARSHALFVGCGPLKGIEIAFRIAAARPHIPFDFVESWPISDRTRAYYEARAQQTGNIAWHKPVSDIRQFYAKARLLLMPSLCEEAYGRVVTEAQASAIPVLASDRGGLPQSVGPGGLNIAAHAPLADWLAALDRMWNDEAEYARLSALAHTHARREEMALERITDQFLELVTDFIAARRGGA